MSNWGCRPVRYRMNGVRIATHTKFDAIPEFEGLEGSCGAEIAACCFSRSFFLSACNFSVAALFCFPLLCPPEASLTKQLEHQCTMVICHGMVSMPSNDTITSKLMLQQHMRPSKRLTCLWQPAPIALKPPTRFRYTPPLPSAATSRSTGSATTPSGLKFCYSSLV